MQKCQLIRQIYKYKDIFSQTYTPGEIVVAFSKVCTMENCWLLGAIVDHKGKLFYSIVTSTQLCFYIQYFKIN